MEISNTPARAQFHDLVTASCENARIQLSAALSAHLVDVLLRLLRARINPDRPTVRMANIEKPGEAIRLGDECLVACGLFFERTLKIGGPDPYIRAGSSAYRFAGMTEAAWNMPVMIDVLRHIPEGASRKDDLALAQEGSMAAQVRLREHGVILLHR